jgi:hypothetical protein
VLGGSCVKSAGQHTHDQGEEVSHPTGGEDAEADLSAPLKRTGQSPVYKLMGRR